MTTRVAKILLLAGVAFFYTLVVFNNLTDYNSNYEFVRHVLLMDSTIPGNHGMGRALHAAWIHIAFYDCIIAWEAVTAVLLWIATAGLVRVLGSSAERFNAAKRLPIIALTLSMLMWFVAFHTVGGEWFLMWQSHTWNGQEDAFRNFAEVGLVLLLILLPEAEQQP